VNRLEFGRHLEGLLRSDLDALAPLFGAMEQLYKYGNQELCGYMTVQLLENLARESEDAGIDLRRLAALLPGPLTRAAWRHCYPVR